MTNRERTERAFLQYMPPDLMKDMEPFVRIVENAISEAVAEKEAELLAAIDLLVDLHYTSHGANEATVRMISVRDAIRARGEARRDRPCPSRHRVPACRRP